MGNVVEEQQKFVLHVLFVMKVLAHSNVRTLAKEAKILPAIINVLILINTVAEEIVWQPQILKKDLELLVDQGFVQVNGNVMALIIFVDKQI
jgi:hypothetical protein